MKTIFHPANERGHANHGWLNAKHSFSFASWYNPEKVHFGALRVLNDDIVAPKMGFSTHPHDNMEIITIPLEGAIAHKDSMDNHSTVPAGEIQVMSAGTGVLHSEFNPLKDVPLNLFQIWIFPNKRNVEPRYDQRKIELEGRENEWVQVLSPNPEDDNVWIHQDAWISLGKFSSETALEYRMKKAGNGAYVMVVEGAATINGQRLNKRDALGIWDADSFVVKAEPGTRVMIIDVPMEF